VSTTPPFGFAKVGVRQMLVPLLLAPFVAVALGFGIVPFLLFQTTRDVGRYQTTLGTTTHGRVRIAGHVSRERMATSPLGKSAAGWVGAVGYLVKDSDGDVTFTTVCIRGDLEGLHIKNELEDWSMSFVAPSDPVALGNHSRLEDTLPIVDIGDPVAPADAQHIPDAMLRACGSAITSSTKGPLLYREAVLAPGTRAEALGCADGTRVVRCAEGGSYLFTTSTIAEIEATSRSSMGIFMLFGGVWNLIIMSIVGFMLADRLVRSKPTFRERLRAQ